MVWGHLQLKQGSTYGSRRRFVLNLSIMFSYLWNESHYSSTLEIKCVTYVNYKFWKLHVASKQELNKNNMAYPSCYMSYYTMLYTNMVSASVIFWDPIIFMSYYFLYLRWVFGKAIIPLYQVGYNNNDNMRFLYCNPALCASLATFASLSNV